MLTVKSPWGMFPSLCMLRSHCHHVIKTKREKREREIAAEALAEEFEELYRHPH